ncbi:hypothetical protein ACFYWP_01500 [Actinacidiphila glaucinigra]|uniref:hypothetical protein n=1 Tax=Actinacidiphila glaucinigra TaxID=235986 RepID=UPI00367BA2BB
MARERDGWEYTKEGPRWAPTVEVALSNILVGKYGDEYDEAKRELDDLVRAAQRDAAEKLYEQSRRSDVSLEVGIGFGEAADLIFPDYPKENDSE